jgi:hypothetical protein
MVMRSMRSSAMMAIVSIIAADGQAFATFRRSACCVPLT